MSEIVVRSAKRNRLYVRRFDHDDARRRYEAGEKVAALAVEYGVTPYGIYMAMRTPEERERALVYKRNCRTGVCETCGGPAMRLIGTKLAHNLDGRMLCARCRSIERRERLRFENGVLVAVRCSSLDCANGERWQPPARFSRGLKFRDVRPGGIHNSCRACSTRARQRHRDAHKVPCDNCGKPRLPAAEKGAGIGKRDSGLCLSCYRTSRKVAA